MVVEIDIESYKINKQKLFDLLKSIKNPSVKKHDMLKKIYIPAFENEALIFVPGLEITATGIFSIIHVQSFQLSKLQKLSDD